MNRARKFVATVKRKGILAALKKAGAFLFMKLRFIGLNDSMVCVDSRRIRLSENLYEKFNGTIKYGPMKGLKLPKEFWWGRTEISSILLGLYEKEVLDCIVSFAKSRKIFIDLGAADGHYGIGVLVGDLFNYSYCYETSELGRETIRCNAEINGVSNRIKVEGTAGCDFYNSLKADGVNLSNCVLLCDIEGGEFELFNKTTFGALNETVMIIEIHDFFFEDGQARLQKLKQDASSFFEITELTTGGRDLSTFEELKALHDNDRWLICSEGRARSMTWLKLEPKKQR